jgi:ketosteroid isomerase-like protein
MIRAVIETKVGALAGALALSMVVLAPIAKATGTSAKAKETKESAADREGLEQAERTWVRALETGDARLLETFVDDEMSFIGPDGQVEDHDAYLAGYRALPSMGVKVQKIDVGEMKVRVLGDTGVVTGHVVARVQMPGDTVVENVRFTRVYQRRGSRWRMVAGQGTRVAPPPASPAERQK